MIIYKGYRSADVISSTQMLKYDLHSLHSHINCFLQVVATLELETNYLITLIVITNTDIIN